MSYKVSLVIPIRNEEESIENLVESIDRQMYQPDEIVLVDGGSTDGTVGIVERIAAGNTKIKFIKTDGATPGKGRNIGIENAANDWIALTDAGIILDSDWLEQLVSVSADADIVYGDYAPVTESLFETAAAVAYVNPRHRGSIRNEQVVSCLLKKELWRSVGGFPDLRASEDLEFVENIKKSGAKIRYAVNARVRWLLQPDFTQTFKKFVLYSKHNVWCGRQHGWHYGIARQYLIMFPFLFLIFFHSLWWFSVIFLWIGARTLKSVFKHRDEFGLLTLLDPRCFLLISLVILTVDAATFVGWAEAYWRKQV